MKDKKRFFDNPIVFSLILNVSVLLLSLIVFVPFFEENDDAFIAMIAEGAFGSREPHLIYSNIILGYIYKGLYLLCPLVRWHSVLQYVFLFFALTMLTYIIQHLWGEKRGYAPAVILILSIAYETYVSIQYSKTAALVSAIGYICLLYSLRQPVSKTNGNIIGDKSRDTERIVLRSFSYIFLVYGMILRPDSFLLATLLMLPVGIYEFVKLYIKTGKNVRTGVTFIGLFAAACCLFFVLWGINRSAYDNDPAWKKFMDYNNTRMQLLDYRYDLMDYNKYGSRLNELGISENDALLYLTWQFGDDKVLSTDTMNSVLNGAPGRRLDIEYLKGLAQHIYEDVLILNPLVTGTIIISVIVFVLLLGYQDKKVIAVPLVQLVIFAGILTYYEYSGRWSHRVVFAALLLLVVSFSYIMASTQNVHKMEENGAGSDNIKMSSGMTAGAVTLIAAACVAVLLGNRFRYNDYVRNEPQYRIFLENTGTDTDTLYIADTFTFQTAYRYDVFEPYGENSLGNFVAVGSWFVNSPITKQITRHYGYENPFEALASGDGNVTLVDNLYADEKLEYLNEHYGDRMLEELPGEYGFRLYRVN